MQHSSVQVDDNKTERLLAETLIENFMQFDFLNSRWACRALQAEIGFVSRTIDPDTRFASTSTRVPSRLVVQFVHYCNTDAVGLLLCQYHLVLVKIIHEEFPYDLGVESPILARVFNNCSIFLSARSSLPRTR